MATQRLVTFDPVNAVLTEASSTVEAQLAELLLTGIGGIGIDMGGNALINLPNPVNASDPATKGYTDALLQGIDRKFNVAALANTNTPLTGLPVIDGYQTVAGDRILLIAQTSGVQNGIWVVASGSWSRPSSNNDYATGTPASGDYVFVQGGNTFVSNGYVCNTPRGSDVVDTNATTWIQFTGAGEIIAGAGLVKGQANGNSLAVALAPASGLQFTSGAIDTLLDPAGSFIKGSAGLAIKVNANNTLATDAAGLRTLGLPNLFTVNGVAVDANVTAANLNALNDGNSSLVDSLHSHQSVLESLSTVATHKNGSTPLAAGDPVQWSSTADTLGRCDAATFAKTQTIGIASGAIPANGNGKIVKRGVAVNVLTQATPGAAVYMAAGGGLTFTPPSTFNNSVIRMGFAKNATDLDVYPVAILLKAAS